MSVMRKASWIIEQSRQSRGRLVSMSLWLPSQSNESLRQCWHYSLCRQAGVELWKIHQWVKAHWGAPISRQNFAKRKLLNALRLSNLQVIGWGLRTSETSECSRVFGWSSLMKRIFGVFVLKFSFIVAKTRFSGQKRCSEHDLQSQDHDGQHGKNEVDGWSCAWFWFAVRLTLSIWALLGWLCRWRGRLHCRCDIDHLVRFWCILLVLVSIFVSLLRFRGGVFAAGDGWSRCVFLGRPIWMRTMKKHGAIATNLETYVLFLSSESAAAKVNAHSKTRAMEVDNFMMNKTLAFRIKIIEEKKNCSQTISSLSLFDHKWRAEPKELLLSLKNDSTLDFLFETTTYVCCFESHFAGKKCPRSSFFAAHQLTRNQQWFSYLVIALDQHNKNPFGVIFTWPFIVW